MNVESTSPDTSSRLFKLRCIAILDALKDKKITGGRYSATANKLKNVLKWKNSWLLTTKGLPLKPAQSPNVCPSDRETIQTALDYLAEENIGALKRIESPPGVRYAITNEGRQLLKVFREELNILEEIQPSTPERA